MSEVYPAIRIRHLWHRFGFKTVLSDVTFDVHAGEIFGFIGPNGAGKTTTIRVMATLLAPMAGRVEIDGIDVMMEPERVRRLIGYMPDHAGVYERVTVREYLEFFADAYRIPSLGVVDAVLELTDIGALENQLVVTLSKGQKQRLQLARILLHDPKVLILDEPASDLDPRARIEIRDLLLDLQSLGKTILLSSHILSELADVCTSVGILEGGRMVVAGPIDEIGHRFQMQQAAIAHGHAPPMQHGHMPWQQPPGAHGPPPGAPPQVMMAPPMRAQGMAPQGMAPQGMAPQGMAPQGMAPQGMAPQGMAPQGMAPQGMVPYGMAPQGMVPYGMAPQGMPMHHVPVTMQRRGVKIRVLGDPNAAAAAVQGGPGILDVKVAGGATLQIGYTGDDQKVAQIVAHLVHRNYGIVSVEHERNQLERIFLEATRGRENSP